VLVCNVSLRPVRSKIAADIAEVTAAIDATTTGNIEFATLVDDPASVGEFVDAYLGEIMVEAASAADVLDGGFMQAGEIVEAANAADVQDAGSVQVVGVDEVAVAADVQDANKPAAMVTWDTVTASNVTLSGGNLVVTSTSTSTNQGAHVDAASAKTAGKYYFELTLTSNASVGGNNGIGIGTTASTYAAMGSNATTGNMTFASGNVYAGGAIQSGINIGTFATGQIVGLAIDLDNRRAWFRKAPAGNWNASGTANPATNTGGIVIPAGTMVPFVTFNATSNTWTVNFGMAGFTGAVPSGFTSGWLL